MIATVVIRKDEDEEEESPPTSPTDVRTGTHGRLPEHLPAVFWTTFQSVTLGCEAVPEKANEASDMPKKKVKEKKEDRESTINQRNLHYQQDEVVVLQSLIFSDAVLSIRTESPSGSRQMLSRFPCGEKSEV